MSVRHDWYQTDEKIVVTVLLKNAAQKNYQCQIIEDTVTLSAENYELKLELLNPIVPEKSSYKDTPSKVEITLFKREFSRWNTLERKIDEQPKPVAVKKKKPEDWDKLAKEVEKDQPEVRKILCFLGIEMTNFTFRVTQQLTIFSSKSIHRELKSNAVP